MYVCDTLLYVYYNLVITKKLGGNQKMQDSLLLDDTQLRTTINYAGEAGILVGVESFLKGLPDSVRHTLSAGELADVVLNMIENIRSKRGEQ